MDILYNNFLSYFDNQKTKNIFVENNLPLLRTIDINIGQVSNPEMFEIFYPALFIDWSETQNNPKEPLELNLSFHVLQTPYFSTENFSENKKKGLQYIMFLKTIKKVLNTFKTPNASKLQYLGLNPNITPYFKYHILNYTCNLDDKTAEPNLKNIKLEGYKANFKIKEKYNHLSTEIDVL